MRAANIQHMKVLYLTLLRKHYDAIVSGKKKTEYRVCKPFWNKRIKNNSWDLVLFSNGYGQNTRSMLVEYLGQHIEFYEGQRCYALELGKIVEQGSFGSLTRRLNKT